MTQGSRRDLGAFDDDTDKGKRVLQGGVAQLPTAREGTGGRHMYLLQDPALASPQKSTPLFLSIFSDRPGGRG